MEKPRIGGYKAGAVPDSAKKYAKAGANQLPPKVDLRKFMTEVESQVGSSCVANAMAGAYEYLAKRELQDTTDVSRLFVYYNARYIDGSQDEDAGSYMTNAIKGLQEYGACSESIWANEEDNILEEPHEDAYSEAESFKIKDAEYIETDLDTWRSVLADGYPIAFALNTFDSFDDACKNRGRVPLPKKTDNVRDTHGWHAMLAVGYSDPDRVFIVRNSWGTEWGEKGYCYIPYDYVIHDEYNGHDSWIIKAIDESNYGEEVADDDESSSFTSEDTTVINDFYITTDDTDKFYKKLDKLLEKYTEDENDYYYDSEISEEDEDGYYEITMTDFYLDTTDPDAFLEELDALCYDLAYDEDSYNYSIEGYDYEEDEVEDEEE